MACLNALTDHSHYFPNREKPDVFFWQSSRDHCLYFLLHYVSLNCLVLVVVGDTALQTQYRLGLIVADCSGAATEEEAAYIIFVLLEPSCFCSWGWPTICWCEGPFDVHREALQRGGSLWHQWPQNLPPISPLEFKFKQLRTIVFVSLMFLLKAGICSVLSYCQMRPEWRHFVAWHEWISS